MIRNSFLKKSFVLLLFVAAVSVSCCKPSEPSDPFKGKPIQFTTARAVTTKASFNGKQPDGKYQIVWENGDVLRISSPEVSWADYLISIQSNLSLSPKTNGTELRWGTGLHHFYAVYPSCDINGNVVSANIPSIQGSVLLLSLVEEEDREYAPLLSQYGFMAAAAEASPSNDPVSLSFNPLFCALQFYVSSEAEEPVQVSGFRVESAGGGALAGCFTAALAAQADPAVTIDPATTSPQITVTLDSDSSHPLLQGAVMKITAIALPQDLTNLTAYFTVNGQEIALPLVDNDGNPITVHPGQTVDVVAYGLLTPEGTDPEPETPVGITISIDGIVVSEYELN